MYYMEVSNQIHKKEFVFGICTTSCECREQSEKTSDSVTTYKLDKGCLVKVFEYTPNGVHLTLLNDNRMLVASNHLYFDLINTKLYKYINAISDNDERLRFYNNTERREFVLNLEKNTVVAVAWSGQYIKAEFLNVDEQDGKNFIYVELMGDLSYSLLRSLKAKCNLSNAGVRFSFPADMIYRKIENQSIKTDKILWTCSVCFEENMNDAKYCRQCLTLMINNQELILQKPKINNSRNYLSDSVNDMTDNKDIPNLIEDHNSSIGMNGDQGIGQSNQAPERLEELPLPKKNSSTKFTKTRESNNVHTPQPKVESSAKRKPFPSTTTKSKPQPRISKHPMKIFVVAPVNSNTIPANDDGIMHKIGEANIGKSQVKANYKQFELPAVRYDDHQVSDDNSQHITTTPPSDAQPPSNAPLLNDVPVAILHKIAKVNTEKPQVQANYKQFEFVTIVPDSYPNNVNASEKPKPQNRKTNQNKVNHENLTTHHCSICRKMIANTIQLDCQHVFCPQCLINSILSVEDAFCPFKKGNYKCNNKLGVETIQGILEAIKL